MTASTIMDEKRNRLTAERAEMLAFLIKNLPVMLKPELEKLEKSAWAGHWHWVSVCVWLKPQHSKILKCSLTGLAFIKWPSAPFSDDYLSFFFLFFFTKLEKLLFWCFCNGCLIPICTKLYKELIAIYFESLPTKLVKLLFSQFQLLYYFIIFFVLNCILNP